MASVELLYHLEEYLGLMQGFWDGSGEGEKWPFQVGEFFLDGGSQSVTTLSTLGLSDFPLSGSCEHCGSTYRHELTMMFWPSFGVQNMPFILRDIGKEAISSGYAYLCGQVIGPRGKMFPDTEMEALFLYEPANLPEDFAVYSVPGDEPRIIVWAIPITRQEAAFAKDNGWESFVELLKEHDPDLFDMYRRSIV